MKQRIVFLHGCGPKPPADDLHRVWRDALQAGLKRDVPDQIEAFASVSSDLFYFADQTGVSGGADFDPEADLANRQQALAELKSLKKSRDFRRRSYDALPGKTALKEFVMDAGASLGASRLLYKRTQPELDAYLAGAAWGVAAREQLVAQLRSMLEAEDRVLVVAHCLGSVLAYDALWSLGGAAELTGRIAFLTMGSALSDRSVQGRLLSAGEQGVARYPRHIGVWYNLAAEDDYVCHDKTIADDYNEMLTAKLVSELVDYTIYNLALRYGRSNAHSSVGYLVHPRTASVLARWLTGDLS